MPAARFAEVARRVARRLVLQRWVERLSLSALPFFGILSLVVIAWQCYTWQPVAAGWIGLCLIVWSGGLLLRGWLGRPTPFQALATWDESAGRHEQFASAYCFESQPARSLGEDLHRNIAAGRLDNELLALPEKLPIRLPIRVCILPLLFIALSQAARLWPAPAPEPRLDDQERVRAIEVADRLGDKLPAADHLQGLDPAERQKVEQLKAELEKTAEKLKQSDQQSPRQTLSELERRANEAEQLAEALGADEDQAVSPEMIAELERHADTAALAAALRSEDAEKIAREADKLADQLEQAKSLEERNRLQEALQKSLAADKSKKPTGLVKKHLEEAHRQLRQKQPQQAGKQLRQLSKSLNRQAQRKQSSRQLQQLARHLRSTGQQIFGRQNSGMQRLAQQSATTPAGMQRLGSQPIGQLALLPGGQPSGQTASAKMQLAQGPAGQPTPGASVTMLSPAAAGNPQASLNLPVPGTGSQPGQQSGAGTPAGAQAGSQAGAIPIPGTMPGAGSSPGQSASAGSTPGGSGSGPGGNGSSSAGGLQAGNGTAPYGNAATKPLTAQRKGTVNAQIAGKGPAQARAVAPQQHQEQAARSPQQVAIDFLKVEEEALSDDPLPLSRREQVLRYFTALRKQLVEEEKSHAP